MSHRATHPTPQIRLYQDWLARERGLRFASYDALWQWSVDDLNAFWQSAWDYFDLQSPTPHSAVLAQDQMPGAVWFPGAQVNYAQQVLRHVGPAHAAACPAIVSSNERGQMRELSWPELRRQVASMALALQDMGLQKGDRVAAYLPNVPEAMVAFLAVVSLGGVWSICAPDMGTHAVLDRFRQIEPVLLLACDGVAYAGRDHDRRATVAELCAALPSVRNLVWLNNLGLDTSTIQTIAKPVGFERLIERNDPQTDRFEPLWLPFDHPLWIVYSSGTTGLPKPIVHGHGGIVLVMLTMGSLHNDLGCSYHPNTWGERFHWYSSTGWVMWNAQMGGLLSGTTCCIYDGNPAGQRKEQPDWGTLWRFAADTDATFFGAGAAFYGNCLKAGLKLTDCGDLSRVRTLGSTGSPLTADVQVWGTAELEKAKAVAAKGRPEQGMAPSGGSAPREAGERGGSIFWVNISGGTDFAGAFVGSCRELPEVPGQMQCRMLGSKVEAWNDSGQPVVAEVGELVCTRPIPSMPLCFWNDEGNQRYLSSYFDMYPPSPAGPSQGASAPLGGSEPRAAGSVGAHRVWRHGDWLRIGHDGGCVIYGRSDATINRHGLRMGTSEIYSAVEALPEVMDSMVVDLEYLGRDSYMPLFVVLREGLVLDDALSAQIARAIRAALSPRFVPDEVVQVAEIPRTLSGKKQELPIKKLMLGQPLERVINRDAMANPGCLDWYVGFAASRRQA